MSVILRNGDTGPQVAAVQTALNAKISAGLKADGIFGKGTEAAVIKFQSANKLNPDGIVGPTTLRVLGVNFAPDPVKPTGDKTRVLGVADFIAAGKELGCPPSMVHALSLKETKGKPFLPDGRPVILFERHQFYKRMKDRALAAKLAETERDICHPSMKNFKNANAVDRYQGGVKEWDFLERAMRYDRKAALESASYGQFQVMGFNAVPIGYKTVDEFVELQGQDVYQHLEAMVRFIKATPLALRGMRNKNFQQVAEGYNGKGYAANRYDVVLKDYEQSVAHLYK